MGVGIVRRILTALERRNRDIDMCALLPHAAVRVFVMGERAVGLENANQSDIAQMREIAARCNARWRIWVLDLAQPQPQEPEGRPNPDAPCAGG